MLLASRLLAFALLIFAALPLHASSQDEVERVLALREPPSGVVFEIVSGAPETLRWAIPTVRAYAERLRGRFPDLAIAVVTHGKEQFALMADKREQYQSLHEAVQQMTDKDQIPVHVCETYAGMHNVTPEDFPEYVDVAPAGPAQINNYRELGFLLIKVK